MKYLIIIAIIKNFKYFKLIKTIIKPEQRVLCEFKMTKMLEIVVPLNEHILFVHPGPFFL